jgi:hypothetical protein
VVASLAEGEAVWLGFQALDPARPARIRVRWGGTAAVDAVTGEPWHDELTEAPRNHLVSPPDYSLPGLREAGGHVPFGTGDLTVLLYEPAVAQVPVRLVAPDEFTRLTGVEPAPLDPDSAYKGWRLP